MENVREAENTDSIFFREVRGIGDLGNLSFGAELRIVVPGGAEGTEESCRFVKVDNDCVVAISQKNETIIESRYSLSGGKIDGSIGSSSVDRDSSKYEKYHAVFETVLQR